MNEPISNLSLLLVDVNVHDPASLLLLLQNLQSWCNATCECDHATKKNECHPMIAQFLDLTLFDLHSQCYCCYE